MALSDIRIFDCVEEVLSRNLGQTEAQSYLTQIRERYYSKHLPPLSFRTLDSVISKCRTCSNAESTPMAGWWNWQDCDLMIVSANAHSDERFAGQLGTLLKNHGFLSSFCGVTHVTKCRFKEVTDQNVSSCYQYVYDQIDVAKPKAIAVIGAGAFELFATSHNNYTSAVGSSWWWGIYKIYALPSSRDFTIDQWSYILKDIYGYIYGEYSDILNLADEHR